MTRVSDQHLSLAENLRIQGLKVVSGEKEGGLRVGSIDRYWLGTVVLEV